MKREENNVPTSRTWTLLENNFKIQNTLTQRLSHHHMMSCPYPQKTSPSHQATHQPAA